MYEKQEKVIRCCANGNIPCKSCPQCAQCAKDMKMFEKWKWRLGLQDWYIAFYPDCIPDDFTLQNMEGESEWTECSKHAVVRILREDCYGNRIAPFDFEKTLVHELLHLKFCLLGESGNDLQDRYVHQLIDDLARAFVAAEREG